MTVPFSAPVVMIWDLPSMLANPAHLHISLGFLPTVVLHDGTSRRFCWLQSVDTQDASPRTPGHHLYHALTDHARSTQQPARRTNPPRVPPSVPTHGSGQCVPACRCRAPRLPAGADRQPLGPISIRRLKPQFHSHGPRAAEPRQAQYSNTTAQWIRNRGTTTLVHPPSCSSGNTLLSGISIALLMGSLTCSSTGTL